MTPSQPSNPQRSPVEVWYLAKNFLTSETSLYIFKRILQALLTLFLASIFSFFVIQLSPGDYLG